MIHNAVLAACDSLDGVKDGVIDDPRCCKFDPAVLECKAGGTSECLTPAQVETARKIYSSAVNPRTKELIFLPLEPGSELDWKARGIPPESHWHYVVVQDPDWDYKTFNFDSDLARGEKIEHDILNVSSPDLKAFFARRGKTLAIPRLE